MAGNHRLVAKVAEVLVAAAMLWRSGGSRDEKEEEAAERKRACEELHRYICTTNGDASGKRPRGSKSHETKA